MTVEECYTKLQGNYGEAKSRLMNDRLIEKFMLKFPADPTMEMLRSAAASGNIEETFRGAHTLKGVAANLAFSDLQAKASDLTEQLRSRENQADPELLAAVEKAYAQVIDTLQAYAAENGK